jgi:hypothetical protein
VDVLRKENERSCFSMRTPEEMEQLERVIGRVQDLFEEIADLRILALEAWVETVRKAHDLDLSGLTCAHLKACGEVLIHREWLSAELGNVLEKSHRVPYIKAWAQKVALEQSIKCVKNRKSKCSHHRRCRFLSMKTFLCLFDREMVQLINYSWLRRHSLLI